MGVAHFLAEGARAIGFFANTEQRQLIEREDGSWHFFPLGMHRQGIWLKDEVHKQEVTDEVLAFGVVGVAIFAAFLIGGTWLYFFAHFVVGLAVIRVGAIRAYAGQVKVPPRFGRTKAQRQAFREQMARDMYFSQIIAAIVFFLVMGGGSVGMILHPVPGEEDSSLGYFGCLFFLGIPFYVWFLILKLKVAAKDKAAASTIVGKTQDG